MPDLEERLRSALRTRADGVRPDPDTWERVQTRIRRRQLFGWAVPATAVAAVAAVAVLVVPQLLPSGDEAIELGPAESAGEGEPGDTATEEDPAVTADEAFPSDALPVVALEDRVGGIAWVDGESLEVQTPGGDGLGRGGLDDGVGVTVAPGSTLEEFVIGAGSLAGDGGCGGTTVFLTVGDSGGHFAYDRLGDCVGPPRFSTDGKYVARVVRDGDEQVLDVRSFASDGTEGSPYTTAAISNAEGDVELLGWFWDADGRQVVHLLDRGRERPVVSVVPLDTEMPQNGSSSGAGFGLPSDIDMAATETLDPGEGWATVAAALRSSHEPVAEETLLLQTSDDEARLWVGRSDGEPFPVGMPDQLAGADHHAWVTAQGDYALVGDGAGTVWHVVLHPVEPIVVELGVDWTGAALLSPEPAEAAAEAEEAAEGTEVTAYLVRATDQGMWVEPATVTLTTRTVGVARASMEALVAGGVEGLETLAPAGTRVLGASVGDGVLTIDLSQQVREGNVGSEGETAFAQQLAHTATQFDEIDAVRVLVEGQPITELWGHIDWSEPIQPDDFALSPIVIEEVAVADGVVTVAGEATSFEGTVELTLTDPDGQLAEETFTTAECGGPCRGGWSHSFDTPAQTPGTWAVTAAEPFITDEGRLPFEARVEFAVE